MGVHQRPDPAAAYAKLDTRLTELERVVRRGKTAPNFRDLQDANLTKITDGQTVVYDAATGKMVPGTGTGVSCVWFQNRYRQYVSNAHKWDIATSVGDTSWFEFNTTDDPGLYDRSHVRIMEPGFVMASAWSNGVSQTSAQIDVFGLSTVARAEGTYVSLAAGWSWTAEEIEEWPTIQVFTAGTGDRFGQLALMFVAGTSSLDYFGSSPNGDPP